MPTRRRDRRTDLSLARGEISDAIRVLEGGNLHFTEVVPTLKRARRQAFDGFGLARSRELLARCRTLMIQR